MAKNDQEQRALFQKEEELLGFHPLDFCEQIAGSAERHCILTTEQFAKSTKAFLPRGSSSLERFQTNVSQNVRLNFDKFELYSLSFIFRLSSDERRLLWRRERAAAKSSQSASSSASPPSASLTQEDDQEDRVRLLTDEPSLDRELEELRRKISCERSALQALRAIEARMDGYISALEPYTQHANQQQRIDSMQQSLAGLRSSIAELADLEQDTRQQLQGTCFDESAVQPAPAGVLVKSPLPTKPEPVTDDSEDEGFRNNLSSSVLVLSSPTASVSMFGPTTHLNITDLGTSNFVEQASFDFDSAPPLIAQLYSTYQNDRKVGTLANMQSLLRHLTS